ncbi:hypothetical protein [Liquorilactobacillus uvarum]|uniref:Uncharacterized protein n=1 Tax=Liquorilactobacillus uvarum DSM 19971 TaxID=1423812 RepID=A0A0R1Q1M5_9LACO|nr:hypothetical protein [Liquorilactobacillus uvarum]KRL38348.1 hypothetical protein FD20_GL001968 [Liquorilactobacillus uvarum DSM 19971]
MFHDIEIYLGDDYITQTLQMYQLQIQKVAEFHDSLYMRLLLSNGKSRLLKLSGVEKKKFIQAIEFTIPCGVNYRLSDLSQVTGSAYISCETTPKYNDWCFYWPGSVITSGHSNTRFSGEHNYDKNED